MRTKLYGIITRQCVYFLGAHTSRYVRFVFQRKEMISGNFKKVKNKSAPQEKGLALTVHNSTSMHTIVREKMSERRCEKDVNKHVKSCGIIRLRSSQCF